MALLDPSQPPKRSRQLPRWVEWLLVVAMAVLVYLEYTHGEMFWTIFFGAGCILMALWALGLLGRSKQGDSDAR